MAFTALTESQIVANMINTYSSLITTNDDINQGSVIRSTFEAFAQELKRLYQNMQESAAETQKTAAYTMFNFPLLPAQAAYTMVTLSVSPAPTSNVTIPAGTTVAVPSTSIQYKTPADIIWPANAISTSVRVVCVLTGTIGNQRAGTITQLVTPITGLSNVTVSNTKDVITGTDLETDDQRADRFRRFVSTLHRGATISIVEGAKTTQIIDSYGYVSEQVTKAQLIVGSGSNTLYIDNGTYDTSAALVSLCQQVINGYVDANGVTQIGYTAAGIATTVQAANLQSITITIKAAPKPGYTFDMISQSIVDGITSLVKSLNVGDTLYLSDISNAIGNVSGVLNFQVVAPTVDTIPVAGTIIKLGTNQPTVSAF